MFEKKRLITKMKGKGRLIEGVWDEFVHWNLSS